MNFRRALILSGLAVVNTAVVILGLKFTTVNLNSGADVAVFGMRIPAYLMGFIIVYIGVRSYFKLFRLQRKLHDPETRFSWQNFRL